MSVPTPDGRVNEALAALKRKEYRRAFAIYELLAQSGSASAMLTLGKFYFNGIGVQKDYDKALYWLERAYGGNRESVRNYAALTLHDIYWRGQGVPIDYKKAFSYVKQFEHLEDPGLGRAVMVYSVAIHYDLGWGVPKDIPKAMELYGRAADAGHILSKIMLERRRILRGNPLAILSWLMAIAHLLILEFIKGRPNADLRLWR